MNGKWSDGVFFSQEKIWNTDLRYRHTVGPPQCANHSKKCIANTGLTCASSGITVSTVGIAPGLKAFCDSNHTIPAAEIDAKSNNGTWFEGAYTSIPVWFARVRHDSQRLCPLLWDDQE